MHEKEIIAGDPGLPSEGQAAGADAGSAAAQAENGELSRAGIGPAAIASAQEEGELRAWVANDYRSTPADHAAFLIDFEAWLGQLPERRRLSAEMLAQGYGTKEVALQVGVTPAAISQARTELARNWHEFQRDRTA